MKCTSTNTIKSVISSTMAIYLREYSRYGFLMHTSHFPCKFCPLFNWYFVFLFLTCLFLELQINPMHHTPPQRLYHVLYLKENTALYTLLIQEQEFYKSFVYTRSKVNCGQAYLMQRPFRNMLAKCQIIQFCI